MKWNNFRKIYAKGNVVHRYLNTKLLNKTNITAAEEDLVSLWYSQTWWSTLFMSPLLESSPARFQKKGSEGV